MKFKQKATGAPSIVKVPEFPNVALEDVWRTSVKLDGKFDGNGNGFVRPDMLADHEVVKTMTINQKIKFWQDVMQLARDRGIDFYWFFWNIFLYGAEGKDGITGDKLAKTFPYITRFFWGDINVRWFPETVDETQHASGVPHLEMALDHWKSYTAACTNQYIQPVLYNRSGMVSIPGQTEDVVDDVKMAERWRKGKIDESTIERRGTEAGFSK